MSGYSKCSEPAEGGVEYAEMAPVCWWYPHPPQCRCCPDKVGLLERHILPRSVSVSSPSRHYVVSGQTPEPARCHCPCVAAGIHSRGGSRVQVPPRHCPVPGRR